MVDIGQRLDAPSDAQRMLRDAAAAFFAKDPDYRRVRAQRGKRPGYDPALWREMAALGWLGLRIPEKHGGVESSFGETVSLFEQVGRSLAPEPLGACALLAGGALAGGDNEALKAELLPRLITGEWTVALAWQEAAAGQRAEARSVIAVRRGGDIVLSGEKRFVFSGEAADAFIVSARTSGGTALYLVERGARGLMLRSTQRVDGGFWGELRLDNVAVPPARSVASPPLGATLLERLLDEARLAASAELLGCMARALEISVEYIKMREQFGRPVEAFRRCSTEPVDLFILTELARSVLLQSAATFDGGAGPAQRAAASQAKARCSHAALEVTKGCIQLHGGIGYTDECNIGLFLKKAMVLAGWLGGAASHRQRYASLSAAGAAERPAADGGEATLRAEVGAWVAANFPPEWRFPPHRLSVRETQSWHGKLYEKGWAAPTWPKEQGGMGLSPYEQIVFQEELDRHGVHIAPNMGIVMLGPLLMRYGSAEQKRRYLPKILSGEVLWCQGYSEPGAGSDLASLRTSAVLEGEHFVVNGQKIWTSFAHEADMIFLLARTDPRAKKQEGISFLLADMRSPGIAVKRIRNLAGGSEFCEVFFDNVRVPKENLVGPLNRGWTMAKSLLGSERIMIGHPRLARVPLDRLRALARTLGMFDEPAFCARFDALCLDVEDTGAAFVRFAEVLRRGGELGPEVSCSKSGVTEVAQRITDLIVEVAGEAASRDAPFVLSGGVELHPANLYFAARPMSIYGGSNEIQRNILARAILELP